MQAARKIVSEQECRGRDLRGVAARCAAVATIVLFSLMDEPTFLPWDTGVRSACNAANL
jgi:hypothetical protein